MMPARKNPKQEVVTVKRSTPTRICGPAPALALALALTLGCSDDSGAPDRGAPDAGQDTAGPSCDATTYLPQDGAVGDFKLTASPGVAADGKQLEALIDGGSEKYKQNSFSCMTEAIYGSGTASYQIKVWLFNQTDTAGAAAAYTATDNSSFTATATTYGDASRENLKLPLDYMADMRKGKYLARVQVDDPAGAADGLKMVQAIAAALP